MVQVLTEPHADLDAEVTITPASVVRLALLGLLGGIFQLSAVSQVTVFGVPADLTPLLVASAGFIAGSVTGAVVRLLPRPVHRRLALPDARRQLARVHRGRLRRRAHPRAARPGPRARAGRRRRRGDRDRRVGFTLLQFLLGVQAPVSLLLLREILLTVVLNTLIALPVYAIMRRALLPFLPEDPRRRRRRAYTTGGLSPISRL